MTVCGLDIGTTGCKISAFSETDAAELGSVYMEYNVARYSGCHELDPAEVFSCVKELLKQITQQYGEIGALGVTSLGESFVLLDENDNILHPAMLYTDVRGEAECEELKQKIPEAKIAATVGAKPHTMFSLPKLMWIKNNHPALFSKAVYAPLMQDYIVYMLSGSKQIDYTLAARSMAFDQKNLCWWEEIFDAAQIDVNLMSRPVPPGTVAGNIRCSLARELGISDRTVIVTGCQDQIGAVIGSGLISGGIGMLGMGTVACVPIILDHMPEEFDFYEAGYSVVPHIEKGKFVCYALSYACGSMLKWFRDNLAKGEAKMANDKGENIYKILDDSAPSEPTGILVLPYFSGAATPYMDVAAKGAIVGLTFEHTGAHLYKAFMEGVAYEMRINLDKLAEFGIEVSELRATGGGASSKVWLSIMSDVLDKPIISLKGDQIGALGTALLAGCATGIYPSLAKMLEQTVCANQSFEPDEERSKVYAEHINKYKKVYSSVRPIT